MNEWVDTALKVLAGLVALLCGGGYLYLRGRARGKASSRPDEVRAEARDEVLEEGRERRRVAETERIESIRVETETRIKEGSASREDAERLREEFDQWPRD